MSVRVLRESSCYADLSEMVLETCNSSSQHMAWQQEMEGIQEHEIIHNYCELNHTKDNLFNLI